MTPTSHTHSLVTRDPEVLRERNSKRAQEAAKLVNDALRAAFKGTRIRLSGGCEVEEIDDLGQVFLSLPAITIATSLSHPMLMAQWSMEELEVASTGLKDRVSVS